MKSLDVAGHTVLIDNEAAAKLVRKGCVEIWICNANSFSKEYIDTGSGMHDEIGDKKNFSSIEVPNHKEIVGNKAANEQAWIGDKKENFSSMEVTDHKEIIGNKAANKQAWE